MRRGAWVLVGLVAAAGDLWSQSAVATGSLSGVVFDSLRMAPLAGASVAPEGVPAVTRTDSAGRFTFDSLPAGRYAITVESDALDSLGVAVSTVTVDVVPGTPRSVRLAVPSLRTLLALACRGMALGDDGGVLAGVVRDAGTGAPLAGATVEVTWKIWTVYMGKMVAQPAQTAVTSGANGVFNACGVPSGAQVKLHARAGARTSGELEVRVADFGIARRDLSVGVGGAAVVRGTVTDAAGAALGGAIAQVEGDTTVATSDDRGAFQLAGVSSGTRVLEVRRVGLAPSRTEVDLRAGAPLKAAIVLRAPPPVLTAVVVRASRGSPAADAEGYEARKVQGAGQFVDRDRIALYGSRRAVELLHGVRGMDVHFTETGTTAFWVQSGAGNYFSQAQCAPSYFLDGIAVDEALLPHANDIENVEVYGPGMAPPRYGGARSSCAVVLMWSRRVEGRKPAPNARPDSAATSH